MKDHIDLQKSLHLKQIAKGIFQSTEKLYVPFGARGVFGGTLVAQALYASILTVPEHYIPHSLHSYFIVGAKGDIPLTYKVEILRDGNSFRSREVRAYQEDTLVFIETVSFTLENNLKPGYPPQLSLSRPKPADVKFEDYVSPREALDYAGARPDGIVNPKNPKYRKIYLDDFENGPTVYKFPKDFYESGRKENHTNYSKKPHEITTNLFVKVVDPITIDPRFHYVALAYYSDTYILIVSMKNYKRPMHSSVFNVSLDHSIYFHKKFNANDWLLFHVEHPRAIDSRSLVYAEIYDEGEIVATAVQEGFVVIHDELLLKASKI